MTAKCRFVVSLLIGLLVLAVRPSDAQVLTGSLFGTVTDESGGVLVGASIQLNSSALIGATVLECRL
jgi:hypothetical protein